MPAKLCVLALVGSAALSACGGKDTPAPEYPPVETSAADTLPSSGSVDPAVTHPSPGTVAQVAPQAAPAPVRVVAGAPTPLEGANPTVRIVSPRNNSVSKQSVQVRLQVKNWETSPDSKHVHLILDNEPYIPLYNVTEPIDLGELVRDKLGKELAPGTHVLRAFPGHPHHESVKTDGAFAVVVFHFKEKTKDFAFNPKAPLLSYSRPKGCVVAGKPVLLDFYVANAKLAQDGLRVRYSIDNKVVGDLTEWVPYHIENLPKGEHTVRLTLADVKNSLVAGAFNDTARSIQVAEQCPAAAGHGGHGGHPSGAPPAAPAGSNPTTEPLPTP